MADKKISELTVATTPTGVELIEIVQGGVNKQTTLQAIADLAGDEHFLGVYASEAALISAHPTASSGDYAFVDAGAASPVELWIWDDDDSEWVQTGSGGVVPPASETTQGIAELATQAETNTGTDDARIVTPLKARGTYARGLAAVAATGAAVAFVIPQYYGSAAAITGNITANTTNAVLGMEQVMRHNDSSEPSFGSEFKRMEGSRGYVTSVDNYIYFKYLSATKIQYTINQEQ